MSKISRDNNLVELTSPPIYTFGEKVISRAIIRNDGTYNGKEVGDVLVEKGDIGYVTSIGTFLQQYYIFGVDFFERGTVVGMRGKELMSYDFVEDFLEIRETQNVGYS